LNNQRVGSKGKTKKNRWGVVPVLGISGGGAKKEGREKRSWGKKKKANRVHKGTKKWEWGNRRIGYAFVGETLKVGGKPGRECS